MTFLIMNSFFREKLNDPSIAFYDEKWNVVEETYSKKCCGYDVGDLMISCVFDCEI